MRISLKWTDISLGDFEKPPPAFINGKENWLGLYETYQRQDCVPLRERIDEIFETTTTNEVKSGLLYPAGQNSCYFDAFENDNLYYILQKYYTRNEMLTIVRKYFTDIKENEENLGNIALALYYGVIDERIDDQQGKLIFDGFAEVTRNEFPAMLFRAIWHSDVIYNYCNSKTKMYLDLTRILGGESWFTPYIFAMNDSLMLPVGGGLTEYNINKPITKLECATLIVNYLYKREKPWKEASQYFEDVILCEDEKFADMSGIELLNELLDNTSCEVDKASYRVLGVAHDIGILKNNREHNSYWYENINRFEAVEMIHNLAIFHNRFRIKV